MSVEQTIREDRKWVVRTPEGAKATRINLEQIDENQMMSVTAIVVITSRRVNLVLRDKGKDINTVTADSTVRGLNQILLRHLLPPIPDVTKYFTKSS